MRHLLAIPILGIAITALSSCSPQAEGTRGFGAVITDSGMKANTDRNHRDDITQHLKNDLDAALAPNWSSRVIIDELPTWIPGVEPTDGDWRWRRATVHITLLGAGPLAHSPDDLRQGVVDYMTKKVTARATNLTVTITQEAISVPAAAQSTASQSTASMSTANMSTAAAAPTPATHVAASARTYTIQANDTLADISTLFYGAPEHWRLIVAANPGMNPADLKPGSVLNIPARP